TDADSLVNPVAFEAEITHHVTRSTNDLENAIDKIGSPIVILTACLLGGSRLPLMLMEHGAVGVIAAPRTVYFQPAGLLSVLLTESLCNGNSTGQALSNGLLTMSADYSDPLIDRDSRDYANQQVLFGDPDIHLYNPSSAPRITSLDPSSEDFGSHTPGRGVPQIAALGSTSYLPDTLSALNLEYEFFESSNFTDFEQLISLRRVVLLEPGTLPEFAANLEEMDVGIGEYVAWGGTLVVFGVTGETNWMPWPVDYQGGTSGSVISIVDTDTPLVSLPHNLSQNIDYSGYFTNLWSNFSVVATDGTNPVVVTATIGTGKVALTTTVPSDPEHNTTIENAAL
ncbi:MAG: hypothetical protein ACFE7R_02175, partial [Candidatus Hodarchaeota archaeon]